MREQLGAITALGAKLRGTEPRRSFLFSAGLTASAVLAITAAMALPTRHAALAQEAPTHPAAMAAAQPVESAPAVQEETESPDSQRFTGRVGSNLSDSLAAAGVPELQGREYVAILAKAIQLANGLSVDDRFDLILERTPNGKLGQLLYVGLDRVARA